MHEYSIVQALLEQVDREAQARQATAVHSIVVTIGELSGVEVDLFKKAFEAFRERTLCESADLRVEEVAARWECPQCSEVLKRGGFLRCPVCGGPARLARGDEIVLKTLDLEVA